jgi:glycosyltransferase involved in cell wall biosynthesis
MRVLHIMASGARGGGADHLKGLLPELAALGLECRAAVGEDGPTLDELEGLGIETDPVRLMGGRFHPRGAIEVARVVRAWKPDLVHCHGTRAAFFSAWVGTLAPPLLPPLLYTVHGLSYRKEMGRLRTTLFQLVEAWASQAAQAVISVSQTDLKDMLQRGLLERRRAFHLPNAVVAERFAGGDRQAARRKLGLPTDAAVVGTVSRLVPQKAVDDLLRAAAAVPDLFLVVVGEGPERPALECLIAELGIGERVRLLGSRGDVPELLPALDIFALSSRWEGEPIALLEAMAAGLPCVATATEGAVEILQDSGAGLLTPVGDPGDLAEALKVLARDPDRRQAMSRAARQAVAERTYARSARRLAEIYALLELG